MYSNTRGRCTHMRASPCQPYAPAAFGRAAASGRNRSGPYTPVGRDRKRRRYNRRYKTGSGPHLIQPANGGTCTETAERQEGIRNGTPPASVFRYGMQPRLYRDNNRERPAADSPYNRGADTYPHGTTGEWRKRIQFPYGINKLWTEKYVINKNTDGTDIRHKKITAQ